MRIKTITCHEVYNYGASLQEYALLAYLKSQGHSAEAIHYKPDYLSGHFNLKAISPTYNKLGIRQLYLLAKLPGRLKGLKRKKAFDVFSQKYIPANGLKYTSNEELKQQLPDADAYICGSDQIWNPLFPNGKDASFYLDFVPGDKLKIAYAASFAVEEIDENQKTFVRDKVRRLDAVSVRETSGVEILKNTGIENAIQVVDPVFLLPAAHWHDEFVQPIAEKFIFVYDFDSNPLIKLHAKKIAKKTGYKIFTINKNIRYVNRNFYLEGPETFLSLIYNAQYVITNSFHAIAFSLIFEKQFFEIDRIENINTRMRDLLNLFGLEQRMINDATNLDVIQEINYQEIHPQIKIAAEKSKQFLARNLS
ncbi:MAG: polysaccharide pyruvyl transferase family protein [Prevotellaceae bacterium]|jgi:hypothetical protein|nr:polysaccharide pyruvyl transferase family protein [Prevotellaceae bacterium]